MATWVAHTIDLAGALDFIRLTGRRRGGPPAARVRDASGAGSATSSSGPTDSRIVALHRGDQVMIDPAPDTIDRGRRQRADRRARGALPGPRPVIERMFYHPAHGRMGDRRQDGAEAVPDGVAPPPQRDAARGARPHADGGPAAGRRRGRSAGRTCARAATSTCGSAASRAPLPRPRRAPRTVARRPDRRGGPRLGSARRAPCGRRVASTDPVITSTSPRPMTGVNVSDSTATPTIAATAGLMYVMTVDRTGPISPISAANRMNAAAVQTVPRTSTDRIALVDGGDGRPLERRDRGVEHGDAGQRERHDPDRRHAAQAPGEDGRPDRVAHGGDEAPAAARPGPVCRSRRRRSRGRPRGRRAGPARPSGLSRSVPPVATREHRPDQRRRGDQEAGERARQVLLRRAEEHPRDRDLDRRERPRSSASGRAPPAGRRASSASGQQDRRGDARPQEHQGGGRDLGDRDPDEQVRDAPDDRHRDEQDSPRRVIAAPLMRITDPSFHACGAVANAGQQRAVYG